MELTLTSWAVAMGVLWVVFSRSEKVASPDAKNAITRWLKNVRVGGTLENWPSTFASVFDSIFGKKHLSWRCFWRSCVASLIAVLVMTFIWAALRPLHARSQMENFMDDPRLIVFYVVSFAVLNLLPDYVSLLESRYILRRMSAVQHSPGRILSLLALDVVLTVSIFFAALFLFLFIVAYYLLLFESEEMDVQAAAMALEMYALSIAEILEHGVFLSNPGGSLSLGIFFYTTFFTSVWIWLYALSGLVVKVGEYFGITVSRLKWFLDIENKPLHSLGVISMLLVTLIYLGVGFYRLVGSS